MNLLHSIADTFLGRGLLATLLLAAQFLLMDAFRRVWNRLSPGSAHLRESAAQYRVARRHLESVGSWQKRTTAAMLKLGDASDAFCAEAERRGRLERVSYAGLKWTLPSSHPLAQTLIAARFPDVPEFELFKLTIGEIHEVGVDVGRALDRSHPLPSRSLLN